MSMTTETTADAAGLGRGGRMSRQRKREAVLRLLRGEELELVSRSLGVTAATLSGWREAFLAAGEASRGRFRIRVKSGHKAAEGTARTRLVISPTTPRLALPAIFF